MGVCASKHLREAPAEDLVVVLPGTGTPDELDVAAQAGDATELRRLLALGTDPDHALSGGRGSALHVAVAGDHAEAARALLEAGADSELRDADGATPLHRAAAAGGVDVAAALLDGGADVDAADRFGNSPLHRAACTGHAQLVTLLLERDAELDARDVAGNSALHVAAAGGQADATQALLAAGADPAARNRAGSTPLHWSVLEGRRSTVESLLTHGADPRARTNAGASCLDLAILTKMREVMEETERDEDAIEALRAAAAARVAATTARRAAKAERAAKANAARQAAAAVRDKAAAVAAAAAAAAAAEAVVAEAAAFKTRLARQESLARQAMMPNTRAAALDAQAMAAAARAAAAAEVAAAARASTAVTIAELATQVGGVLALAGGLIKAAAEAYGRVHANHARCRLLHERMQLLQPCLESLQRHVASPAAAASQDVDVLRGTLALLRRVRDTFADALELIDAWGRRGAGFLGSLRSALAAPRYGAAFDAVRTALESRIQELQLDAAIAARLAAVDTRAWAAQDASAARVDAAALPAAIASVAEDREALEEMLREAGSSQAELAEQLKRHGMAFADVDKALRRVEALVQAGNKELDAKLDKVLAAVAYAGDAKAAAAVQRPAGLIDWADIRLQGDAPVGAGGFGSVWLGTWRGTAVAVKRLSDTRAAPTAQLDKRSEREIFREAALMAALPPSPHVVQLYGAVIQAPHYALIMEFCEVPGGRPHDRPCNSLDQLLRDDDVVLPWAERLRIALGVAAGLAALHAAAVGPAQRPVIHGDLKSANVLLVPGPRGQRFLPKISDFGLARVAGATASLVSVASPRNSSTGTLRWCAPELLRGGRPSAAADVYALGMVFYEIASRQFPFAGKRDDVLPSIVAQGRGGPAWPAPPSDADAPAASAALADAMERCWVQEAWRRPDAATLLPALEAALRAEEARTQAPAGRAK